jgi:hypothetical protein
MTRWLCLLATACTTDASPTPAPAVKAPPAEAAKLAAHFAPEIVGKIVPAEPVAGDYAMALDMSFVTFPTTELRISAERTGAMTLTLALDGTARACVGARDHSSSLGQWNYEPPGKRKHSDSAAVQLYGLAGTWKVVDGVAAIRFARTASGTCDVAGATPIDPPEELRCVGVATTDRIPAGSLACETATPRQLLALGMAMAVDRKIEPRPHTAPGGTSIVLGKPGIATSVKHNGNAREPVFAFIVGQVKLDAKDYQPPKR